MTKNKSKNKNKKKSKSNIIKKENEENVSTVNSGEITNSLKVQQSSILGRYYVSSKSINAGEIILKDEAMVVGPCNESRPLCIGCYIDIELKKYSLKNRCKFCGWPLCKNECPGWHKPFGHSKEECDCLSQSLIKSKDVISFTNYYYALTPLRCLLLKKINPEMWNLLKTMETHTDKRKENSELWKMNQKMAVDVIQKQWGLFQFKEEEIHFVCGVLEVNAFEINNYTTGGTQYLQALYPKSFLFAHDCVPNSCRSTGKDFQITFRTLRDVLQNEIVTISYTYILQSTLKRREHLQRAKFFSCTCKRCSDPTELGTYLSAMKCDKCIDGIMLPEEPLNEKSFWKCNFPKCQNKIKNSLIKSLWEKLFIELDSIDGNNIEEYEKFLKKCQKIFHENHFLCLSAMHCLSRLYGKIDGYLINDLPNILLERKIYICRRLINIFEKLQPGLSKEKGLLYYELHAPLMIILRKKYETKSITNEEMNIQLQEIINYLKQSRLILSTEPEYSDEGQISQAADLAIKALIAS